MSAPTDVKLVRPNGERRQLSDIEQQLIVDFRRMDDTSRSCISKFSTAVADKDVKRARKAAPALRLVSGGSQ